MYKLFADFETYYDQEYSLRKMSPAEYVFDPRFEALGCAFALDDGRKFWIDGPDLPRFFGALDWTKVMFITHNALFDAVILAFHFKVFPKMYGDTLAMARNWISHSTGSVSLDAVAKFYGLGEKGNTILDLKGVNFQQLKRDAGLYHRAKGYAINDVVLCKAIFEQIIGTGFPISQLEIIDWVTRMAAEPKFEADQAVLAAHYAAVVAAKQRLLDDANLMSKDNLLSDPKFAAMLLMCGVEPPKKTSKTTGNETWAFAKSDKDFTDLLEHPDPYVQALVAARLGNKTTLEETRAARFLSIARVTPKFPIPLKYSGAHTHRFSGDWKINAQNLTRGGELRKSLRAPKGKVVVAVDASQIEARLNATWSGQRDLVEAFRRGDDVYSLFAQEIYNHPVNKKEYPTERFVGKTGILSLGYGSSAPVFQGMLRNQGQVILPDRECYEIVVTYRKRYGNIVEAWNYANNVILPSLATKSGGTPDVQEWGCLRIVPGAIVLPNGNRIRYRDLRHEYAEIKKRFGWAYNRGPRIYGIYGAKVMENIIQALAFVHIIEVAIRVKRLTEFLPQHQVHDELIYIVDEGIAENLMNLVIAEMRRVPDWLPLAPLDAEGHIGVTYYDAK